MLWVGGGILVHGLEEMHILDIIPHTVDGLAHAPPNGGSLMRAWSNGSLTRSAAPLSGLVVGGVIPAIVRQLTAPTRKRWSIDSPFSRNAWGGNGRGNRKGFEARHRSSP